MSSDPKNPNGWPGASDRSDTESTRREYPGLPETAKRMLAFQVQPPDYTKLVPPSVRDPRYIYPEPGDDLEGILDRPAPEPPEVEVARDRAVEHFEAIGIRFGRFILGNPNSLRDDGHRRMWIPEALADLGVQPRLICDCCGVDFSNDHAGYAIHLTQTIP